MKTIDLDAMTLQYQDQGEGMALVFLHGALSNHQTWRKTVSSLSKSYRCILPDLPLGGHEFAMPKEADLTPEGISRLLLALLDELKLEQVVLVANDTGGAYAQIFAAHYPEKVAGLILSNCDCLDVFPPKQFSMLQKMINLPGYTFVMAQLFRVDAFLTTPNVMGLLSNALTGAQIKALYVKPFIENVGIRRDFQKVVNTWSIKYTLEAASLLVSYSGPVLIIWGEEDRKLFPISLGRRLAGIFNQVAFRTVEGAMTYVQEDQPEQFVNLVESYLVNHFPQGELAKN
ncbi:putative hydrolase [Marinomonas sp. MED121]|uniref:alpha/beta fold hydrolase n=1 Tax=Marinomonas sp. MED121 TaxID=314277 RepID=UPI00006910AE|nr:alpha/beta hydrolase [Marinomonas sp. MED121]EAQ67112.1 putative hydrolase [Marinomonas sp. MED121]